ncbi:MAG: nucleotide exchange factor GrpE [Clostridia bacterium]|nr:nucleotide exchange factor GrpE [Clostridia bacterium]
MTENENQTKEIKEEVANEEVNEKKDDIIKENEEKSELQKKQIELDELDDRYKRVFAEFENYKKRTQKERDGLYNSVLGDIIVNMLPILDNLQMAVNAECKDEGYKQGVELVEKQFKEFLSKNNVEEIPAVGEVFDPSVHEAVSRVIDDAKQSGEILQEYRKGYKLGSKVLRHSMVVVNQ